MSIEYEAMHMKGDVRNAAEVIRALGRPAECCRCGQTRAVARIEQRTVRGRRSSWTFCASCAAGHVPVPSDAQVDQEVARLRARARAATVRPVRRR